MELHVDLVFLVRLEVHHSAHARQGADFAQDLALDFRARRQEREPEVVLPFALIIVRRAGVAIDSLGDRCHLVFLDLERNERPLVAEPRGVEERADAPEVPFGLEVLEVREDGRLVRAELGAETGERMRADGKLRLQQVQERFVKGCQLHHKPYSPFVIPLYESGSCCMALL